MSFGWSAGDIDAAASLVYRLIQAPDSCDGAAGDYREALSFLRDWVDAAPGHTFPL
ncbi:hypothetical protein EDB80DRAFT_702743 [Ilyonectria destructans]|nr:hypothetical protein EDB80DRAFT_702743 [Ilyonectria destructans]